MGIFASTLRVLFKRPSIVVFLSVLFLAFCYLDYRYTLFSLFTLLFNVSALSGGGIFEIIMRVLNLGLKFLVNPTVIMYIAIFIVSLSMLLGFLFSGFFGLINNALEKKQKFKGEFFSNVKRYFLKMFVMNFIVIGISFLFVIFILIACVPSMVITRAAYSGRVDLMLAAFVVDFITVFVIFFSFMFFRIYVSFWYPAAVGSVKMAFVSGVRAANSRFWRVLLRFIVLDALFIGFQLFAIYLGNVIGNSIILLLVKWVFDTLFFAFIITYVFVLFKRLSARKENSQREV